MRNLLFVFAILFCVSAFAQPFEGTITVIYKNEKGTETVAQVKVLGNNVHIKQTQNGNKKYDYFVVNLDSKDFYTLSTPDKKVAIKYNLDYLLEFYERNAIKEGYKRNYNITLKASDKTKEEDGLKLTKATGENELLKVTVWTADVNTPLNQLIPLLRLLGNWNEAQGNTQTVVGTEVSSKAVKKETSVQVTLKRENIAKALFDIPKDYTQKDFEALMDENKLNKDLKAIIQTFTEF